MALREEMVENGLKFLQHPNVQSTPLSERVMFLEGKGMTKEEIREAIERHQNGGTSTTSAAASPAVQSISAAAPMMMSAAAPMQMMPRRTRYPGYVRVLWTVSSIVGAASILTFLWNYAVQAGYIPWLRSTPRLLEAAEIQEEKKQEAKKDEELLTELSNISSAIQKQTDELSRLSTSLDEKERDLQSKTLLAAQITSSLAEQGNAQSIAELKAEISTLKALLVAKTTNGGDPSGTASREEIKGGQANKESGPLSESKVIGAMTPTVPQTPVETPKVVSKAERMEMALKKLRTENSPDQLKLAAGILSMYVKNLVENPDVPRYRRIAPGNANFKQKIEPLKHHEELLKSIGFETTGLNMEWKWHTASRTTGAFDENLAILRALLEALQSLTSTKASSNLALEEIAHANFEKFTAEQKKTQTTSSHKKTTSGNASTTATTITETQSSMQRSTALFSSDEAPAGPASTSLDAFMARLEQQTSVGNLSNGDISMKRALSAATASSNNVAAVVTDDEEEKMPIPMAKAVSPTVTAGRPSYPESFKEVMDLVQKGEPVPGIREIEDKLSVDSSELLGQQMKVGEAAAGNDSVAAAAVPTKPWEKVKA
ncbi:hypothetical protein PHYBOEH_004869 [Phytophthora boehmeriae]|uniref:Peroxin-14 n=1 Tax=Phytophthora boehmeriae TaxID=109152 RepID=A0A8T1WRW6_9STRA|nr:hypothetical protein PHYBOEH_004869 [Phytophthora boehmeriae]